MIQYIHIQTFAQLGISNWSWNRGRLRSPTAAAKSNIYNAIHLLTAAADGRLSGFI